MLNKGERKFLLHRRRQIKQLARLATTPERKKAELDRMHRIDRWLREKPERPKLTQRDFRDKFKKAVGASNDTDSVMEINDVKTLEDNWSKIRFRNIQIKSNNPEVYIRAKELVAKDRNLIKPKGFR